MRVDVDLNMDYGTCGVSTISNGHLLEIAECNGLNEAVECAKNYIKDSQSGLKRGDMVMTYAGTIYTWTGSKWDVARPSR